LQYEGQKMSFAKLTKFWEASGQACGNAGLRTYKFTADHFKKISCNRIRVYLVVQITLHSMMQLINTHARHSRGGIAVYALMEKIMGILGKLIDMMKVNQKNWCHNIHTPAHIHLNQLFDAIKVCQKWKNDCEEKEHVVQRAYMRTFSGWCLQSLVLQMRIWNGTNLPWCCKIKVGHIFASTTLEVFVPVDPGIPLIKLVITHPIPHQLIQTPSATARSTTQAEPFMLTIGMRSMHRSQREERQQNSNMDIHNNTI
jgi:hypothetical protein